MKLVKDFMDLKNNLSKPLWFGHLEQWRFLRKIEVHKDTFVLHLICPDGEEKLRTFTYNSLDAERLYSIDEMDYLSVGFRSK